MAPIKLTIKTLVLEPVPDAGLMTGPRSKEYRRLLMIGKELVYPSSRPLLFSLNFSEVMLCFFAFPRAVTHRRSSMVSSKTSSIKRLRISFYVILLTVMICSAFQLENPTKVKAFTGCCTTGSQCTTKSAPKCCVPSLGEAFCSESAHNYCRSNSCT